MEITINNNKPIYVTPVLLKSPSKLLEVGGNNPIRVNCNVGINNEAGRAYEIERLEAICNSEYRPDTFMDLSVGRLEKPFYKEIQIRFDCPVGFVPSYLLPANKAITNTAVLDMVKRLADDGIAFITLHLTASQELYNLVKKTRKIPITSRGGCAVLNQMKLNCGKNIWIDCLPDIIEIAKTYGIVISLGSTFRPAGIFDACDEAHLKETEEQQKLCRMLYSYGVQVMVENVGHISIEKLERHCELLRQMNAPIMPLGPTPTDSAVGADHIAASVGAAFMGYWGCAHIINCITRAEHENSTFTIEETLEALRSAKVTAHIIDVARGIDKEIDNQMYSERANKRSCMPDNGIDCTRCAQFCPLKLDNRYGTEN